MCYGRDVIAQLIRAAIGGAVVALLVGCGPTVPLVILAHDVPDDRGTVYIEGSIRYVRVTGADGRLAESQIEDGGGIQMKVAPGRYEVTSWERVCPGNCDGELEPPTNECSAILEIPAGGTGRVDITWTVPNPCVMETAIGIS